MRLTKILEELNIVVRRIIIKGYDVVVHFVIYIFFECVMFPHFSFLSFANNQEITTNSSSSLSIFVMHTLFLLVSTHHENVNATVQNPITSEIRWLRIPMDALPKIDTMRTCERLP